jgi:alkanesulfonate monooxygenase SsuD/methylene tetrahydromethanopterin reductase-like flavin-dependent oxidoreductase (luciferase family)
LEEAAIRDSLVLARDCDALGYERFWVPEHHNAASIVGTAPEVLAAAIAAAHFFGDGASVDEALGLYRRNYRPSERYPKPCATICVWALAAEAAREAQQLLTAREHWRVGFEKGLRLPLEEIVINTWTFDPEARRHSYALLARAFGLHRAAPAP